ncbi:hypothetical protein B4083_3647 [Bacillus cereus]|nr:hypothetical protein B4083_3647 [Bacillus cereus]
MKVSLFHRKTFIPLFTGSKNSTSKFGWSPAARKRPIGEG